MRLCIGQRRGDPLRLAALGTSPKGGGEEVGAALPQPQKPRSEAPLEDARGAPAQRVRGFDSGSMGFGQSLSHLISREIAGCHPSGRLAAFAIPGPAASSQEARDGFPLPRKSFCASLLVLFAANPLRWVSPRGREHSARQWRGCGNCAPQGSIRKPAKRFRMEEEEPSNATSFRACAEAIT